MSLRPGESVLIPRNRCGRCPRVQGGEQLEGKVSGSAHHVRQYTVKVACEFVLRLSRVLCTKKGGPGTCTVHGLRRISHGENTVDVLVKKPHVDPPAGQWQW
ncbi:hypothetical protein COU79_03600 [Candidatus Peregrinibacteria bacterium CG10_big_fil_rev_8_21_14_0_10_54_7]|nr:MAG: hypothetical protein COU79_03600 [Candidatus Peregrinibacteria bacterium CG10_big_fil_rev_8_21_14_0_10_54_7]